jgi:HD-like signal output (HDOD) protein
MGKMVFSNLHKDTAMRISDFCERRGIPTTILERMSDGIDHAEVGARLAERWNFPDVLINAIRYHHMPLKAHPPYRDVAMVVSVANELAHMATYDPNRIDIRILRHVGLDNADKAKQIFESLNEHYKSEFDDM